jgi:two-component system, OmpR family, phosphate regulon sensor histidine kinase PhoR
MVRPQRYFAWRVARQMFFLQFALIAVLLLVVGFSIRIHFYETVLSIGDRTEALGRFDQFLTSLLVTVFAMGVLAVAIISIRLSRPLGRLIQRARELRRLDADSENEPNQVDERTDIPGEWSDLERALNRIHRDLRRRTEELSLEHEELTALLSAVSDAILAVDTTEQQMFFNSQFFALFRPGGREDRTLRLGELFRSPEVLACFRQALKTGQMVTANVSLHTFRHTLPRHFSVSVAPLRSQDGAGLTGVVGVFHDVTELKQSEQIRIEFVGNASHELRTPLTNIKGYVDTLKEDLKVGRVDEAPHFIDVISRNVDRLIFLVSDLLDLSTLESGAELERVSVSTSEVTDAAVRQIEPKRAARNQKIVLNLQTESVMADPQRLEQVLVNLVSNAVKYTPEGSEINVSWSGTPNGVELRVKDNGPGIPLEHQARLFERFYRVDAGRSRDQGGTGLGLSIVKHIMLKHGGSVRVQSTPGQGAEFICLFPL